MSLNRNRPPGQGGECEIDMLIWKTADSKIPILSLEAVSDLSFTPPPVYLLQPNGEYIKETFYDGDGVFNGVSAYEWLALMNLAPTEISEKISMGENLMVMGFSLEFSQQKLKYPLKFSFNPKAKYAKLPPSEVVKGKNLRFTEDEIHRLQRILKDQILLRKRTNRKIKPNQRGTIMSLKSMMGKKNKMEPGYGVALEVITSKIDGNNINVKGRVLNGSVFAKVGEVVTVKGDERMIDNLKRGGSTFKGQKDNVGTILCLEGCKQVSNKDGERVISTRYATTIRSNHKDYNYEPDFVSALASGPVLHMPNVNPVKGEGKQINYAMNTGKYGDKDIAWVRSKLEDTEGVNKKVSVSIDTINPAHATFFNSLDELRDIAEAHCSDANKFLLLRVADDSGDAAIRKLQIFQTKNDNGNYHLDFDKTFDYIAEKGLFHNISVENEAKIFEGAKNGSFVVEAIPGERLWMGSDSKLGMIKKNLASPPADDKIPLNFTFGDSRYPFTKVLMSCLNFEDGGKMITNIVREQPGHFIAAKVPTPNLPNGVQKVEVEPELTHEDVITLEDGTGPEAEAAGAESVSEKETFDVPSPGM